MINIKELIDDPAQLNADTLPELEALVKKYPFFQVARLLYVSNLYKLHSPKFGEELKKASVLVADRTALFALTESCNYTLPTAGSAAVIETEDDKNRTISLIDNFLSNGLIELDENNEPRKTTPSVADLTNDYASFLIQQDDTAEKDTSSKERPQLRGSDLIDDFIEKNKGKQRFEISDIDEKDFVSPEFSNEEEEVYTESMVNIYIKQGRYKQALEILRKICLNNPKKSSNFASQINLLEIITNNKIGV